MKRLKILKCEPFELLNTWQRCVLLIGVSVAMVVLWHMFLYASEAPKQVILNKQLSKLEKQNKDLASWLKRKDRNFIYENHLVSPEEMGAILRKLFYQVKDLQLISMSNMPPVLLSKKIKKRRRRKGENTKKERSLGGLKHPELQRLLRIQLKAHDIIMVFQGNYFATLDYLKRIDEAKLPLLWRKITYRAKAYPQAKVTLVLRSLSEEKDWLRA